MNCARCNVDIKWPGNWNVNRINYCPDCRAEKAEARVAELEAELVRTRADSMKWDVIQKGKEKEQYDRAELGWERVEELAKRLGDEKARAEKAEALLQRAIGFGLGGSWEHEAATLLEGHEREAD